MKYILKKLKLLIKNIKLELDMCFSKSYSKFRNDKEKKIILLDTPEHSNIGDQAIAVAELDYIKKNFPTSNLYEFTHKECASKTLFKFVTKNDIVLIHGGGFIGSLWIIEHNQFIKILKRCKHIKTVVFPQTIYFYEKDKDLFGDFFKTINTCDDLTIFTREKNSYDLLKNNNAKCDYKLIPDIVFSLNVKLNPLKNNKVLLCFRSDLEKNIDNEKIINILKSMNLEYDVTDMISDNPNCYENRETIVYEKLEQFSNYNLIITDRLHAMIFATLAGTPCIAFDNISKKVSGVYEWIKSLEHIKCIDKVNFNDKLVKEMMSNKNYSYDSTLLCKYFDNIKNILAEDNNK